MYAVCQDKFVSMYLFRTFTHNMLAFGLSRKLCNDFLKKQAVIGNLNEGNTPKEWFNHVTPDEHQSSVFAACLNASF